MSSLLENQTYKKKLSFVKIDDSAHKLAFMISVNANHDIDKTILADIEDYLQEILLENYEDADEYEGRIKLEKEMAKLEKAAERDKQKEERERLKEEQAKQKEETAYALRKKEEKKRYEKMIEESKLKAKSKKNASPIFKTKTKK